jgi:HK97 family phage portal protein
MGAISTLLERRVHPRVDDDWLVTSVGGQATKAGRNVSQATALNYSAVFACIRVISETLASLPLITYRRLEPRGKERAASHPLFRVLHDQANSEMTSMIFRETITAHAVSWGNGYAEIERDRAGRVIGLWPLLPDRTWPVRRNKVLSYRTIIGSGEVGLRADQVLHVPGLGWDGLAGYSPITLFREAIGLGLAAEELGGRFFGDGMKPGGVLEYPGKFENDEARTEFRRVFNEAYKGLSNAQRLLILEDGLKWKSTSIPPNDAQFLETRKFQIREIARIFRVPPHLIADLDNATFTNIEHQGLEFIIYTLRPWLVRWEQAIKSRLITAREPNIFAEYLVDGLARGDLSARYTAYNTARMGGWLSSNDIRELENMNPIEQEGGDLYLAPLNMTPLDQLGGAADESGDDGAFSGGLFQDVGAGQARGPAPTRRETRSQRTRRRLQKAHEPLVRTAANTVIGKEVQAARKAIKGALGARGAFDLQVWIDEFYPDHSAAIVKRFMPVMMAMATAIYAEAANEIDADGELGDEGEDFVRSYVDSLAIRMTQSSIGQLRRLIAATEEADLADVLETRLGEWEEKRPGKLASREVVQMGSAVAKSAWAFNGIRRVIWVTVGDNCPLCEEIDGRSVEITKSFLAAGDRVDPGVEGTAPLEVTQSFGHPPLHEGCDCTIGPG